MKKYTLLFLLFGAFITVSQAADISLDNSPASENKTEVNVGYVDVNVLFKEHPMTAQMKEEFLKEADKRKQNYQDICNRLSVKENMLVSGAAELKQLKLDIENIKKNQTQVLQSTGESQGKTSQGTAVDSAKTNDLNDAIKKKEMLMAEKEKGMETVKIDIEKEKAEISGLRKKHKEELEKFENKQTEVVMADLYQVIEEVAKEENLSIILDKNNILYGKSAKNVTDKVKRRLQGR